MSIDSALVEWATILKNDIVLDNRSLRVLSEINLLRIGSL
jgi:hypothetical protein